MHKVNAVVLGERWNYFRAWNFFLIHFKGHCWHVFQALNLWKTSYDQPHVWLACCDWLVPEPLWCGVPFRPSDGCKSLRLINHQKLCQSKILGLDVTMDDLCGTLLMQVRDIPNAIWILFFLSGIKLPKRKQTAKQKELSYPCHLHQ